MRLPAGLITITAAPTVTVLVSDFIGVEFVGAAGLGVLVEVDDRAKPCGVLLRWLALGRCGLR
jgi:anti-anti-sigma regulatory factor